MDKELTFRPELLEILKRPDLLDYLNHSLDNFVAGEWKPRHVILLCAAGGRLVVNSNQSSYNLCVNDSSGVGKDYVLKKVLSIIPDEHCVMRKGISPKVWRYWHNAKYDPSWTWDGKVAYLEDITNSCLNDETFKVLASSGNDTSTVVIQQKAHDIRIMGKPVLFVTSASAYLSDEMRRRFVVLQLDDSDEQTYRIKVKQAELDAEGIVPIINPAIKDSQKRLQRVKVKVPWLKGLIDFFPNTLNARTVQGRFADYIKASVALHQYQRKKDSEGFYYPDNTGIDYEHARKAFLETTSNIKLVPLIKNQKKIREVAENEFKEGWFSLKEIVPYTLRGESQTRRDLNALVEMGFLEVGLETDKEELERRGSKRPYLKWKFKGVSQLHLPEWSELLEDPRFKENVKDEIFEEIMEDMKSMKIMTGLNEQVIA